MALELRCKELVDQGEALFSKRQYLMSLWQETADNFYVERADFTLTRELGEEFAAHLDTSYPLMARRDLGNAFGAMLRPSDKDWFHIRTKREEAVDEEGRGWLQRAERTQRRAMYDRNSGFVRATKEGDMDFAAFGQCILSSEIARPPTIGPILLHRSWHLRDVVWVENAWGKVGTVWRKWTPTARQLTNFFHGKVSEAVKKLSKDSPQTTVNICHVMVPSTEYYDGKFRQPYVSIYVDLDNEHKIEEVGLWTPYYIIPRWQTVSGSQYAFSPATVTALPDARLIQSIAYTLLTAGEKAVDPPLIGVQESIKGGIETFPGGFTAVDAQYDERLGEVLRPLNSEWAGTIPIGFEMQADVRAQISEAFYLNKLTLPGVEHEMTAFETSKRIEEYIRNALPLFEPMESDYNGAICEQDFDLLLRAGAFGPPDSIPQSLRNQETEFHFESPLRDAADRIAGQKFLESKQLVLEAGQLDPVAPSILDATTALRDALHGIAIPSKWLRDEEAMEQMAESLAQEAQIAKTMETASAGAQVAEQVGAAEQAMQA